MIAAAPAEEKIVKSFRDTNYFAKGTYKRDLVELFSTATLANFATKTVLAPLERWKIIKQTQTTYELRPMKFTSFANYLTSKSFFMQESTKSKAGRLSGEETLPTYGFMDGKFSSKLLYMIQ